MFWRSGYPKRIHGIKLPFRHRIEWSWNWWRHDPRFGPKPFRLFWIILRRPRGDVRLWTA